MGYIISKFWKKNAKLKKAHMQDALAQVKTYNSTREINGLIQKNGWAENIKVHIYYPSNSAIN
jgi:hypothetical protein